MQLFVCSHSLPFVIMCTCVYGYIVFCLVIICIYHVNNYVCSRKDWILVIKDYVSDTLWVCIDIYGYIFCMVRPSFLPSQNGPYNRISVLANLLSSRSKFNANAWEASSNSCYIVLNRRRFVSHCSRSTFPVSRHFHFCCKSIFRYCCIAFRLTLSITFCYLFIRLIYLSKLVFLQYWMALARVLTLDLILLKLPNRKYCLACLSSFIFL